MERRKKINVQKAVLTAVAVAGFLAVAVVAPNALGILAKVGKRPHKRQSEVIKTTQRRLVQKGLLKYESGYVRLTPKGERELKNIELRDFQIKKPRHWDGKWRVLIFDIAEKRRGARDQIRQTLQRVGFAYLQNSVWLYPYDCQELVTLLKADLKLGKTMLYMTVADLEGDRPFREYFGLLH